MNLYPCCTSRTRRKRFLLLPSFGRAVVVTMMLLLNLFQKSRCALQGKIPVSATATAAAAATLRTTAAQQNHRRMKNDGRYRRVQELLHHGQRNALTKAESLELASLQNKGDPYDASLFTEEHLSFKEAHNQAFVTLAKQCHDYHNQNQHIKANSSCSSDGSASSNNNSSSSGPVLYLDGADGGTTRVLLDAGHDPKQVYIVNEWQESVNELLIKYKDILVNNKNIHYGRLQDMSTLCSDVAFVAVYLDGCGGATKPLVEMLNVVLIGSLADSMAIGFTLTNAEPSGRSLIDRVQDVTRHVHGLAIYSDRNKNNNHENHGGQSQYYKQMYHVADDPYSFGIDFELKLQCEGTTTCWLVLRR